MSDVAEILGPWVWAEREKLSHSQNISGMGFSLSSFNRTERNSCTTHSEILLEALKCGKSHGTEDFFSRFGKWFFQWYWKDTMWREKV